MQAKTTSDLLEKLLVHANEVVAATNAPQFVLYRAKVKEFTEYIQARVSMSHSIFSEVTFTLEDADLQEIVRINAMVDEICKYEEEQSLLNQEEFITEEG